jgi:hypothetical protein
VLLYLGFLKSYFLSSFSVAMSCFIYHYLSVSPYVSVILVIIVKNDLGNKSIYVLSLSNTLYMQFFPYYHLII